MRISDGEVSGFWLASKLKGGKDWQLRSRRNTTGGCVLLRLAVVLRRERSCQSLPPLSLSVHQ